MSFDVYREITNSIVRVIEAGEAGSWRMPWHSRPGAASGLVLPHNPLSGTRYRGMNVPILWAAAEAKGYATPQWATYKQWAEKGAQVRKGERSHLVFFWKQLVARGDEDSDGDREPRRRVAMMARAYNVFNAAQVDGWQGPAAPAPAPIAPERRILCAETFFGRLGATLQHGGDRAFYAPSRDLIQMPAFADFDEPVAYYATLGHEHVHWTAEQSRCDRDLRGRFGDEAYAFEELIAELGAAFLCAELGLANEPRPDHAAYIASWLRVLKNDSRAVFTAGAKAQAATDWLVARGRAAPAE